MNTEKNSFLILITISLLIINRIHADTCSYMWDPIFESNSNNQPSMCPVETTSGSTCIFPFNYNDVTYTTCTVNGPNNPNYRPQCAISVNANQTVVTWSFCIVPIDAVVYYITTRKAGYSGLNDGSLQGGTMIWIYGNRFADNGFSSVPSVSNNNIVKLVDSYSVYDCEMHNDKVTSTQLTCYASAMPESVYQIRIYVNNQLIPLYQYRNRNNAVFAPSLSHTPIITNIIPQTGTPQTVLSLEGSFKSACYARDIDGCSQDNNPLISRIYIGGHLCNMINQVTGKSYSNVTDTNLQCNFEGTEVGIFNISMLVTNEYGRSLTNANLYRISADENLYTFQSYAVVSSITPNSGSTAGSTTLTINGNYFSNSVMYPLKVNIAGQPCTIRSSTTTTIQCQTSEQPSSNQNQYQGARGLHIFRQFSSYNQASLSSSTPPLPDANATQTWTDDALYSSNSNVAETVWLIGFIRVPKTATFNFILDTNGVGAIFLSTNDSPMNKIKISDKTTPQSNDILLQKDVNYYLFAVASSSVGSLRLGIQARMHETTLTADTSSLVLNEIQRININSSVTLEQQRIVYTKNSANGTAEIQVLQVDSSTFQIGFRGVYTMILSGRPTASTIQSALNDLPSISPLTVSVIATSSLYYITFPIEMGNVELLTCISSSSNVPNITEITRGVSSESTLSFSLDNQYTIPINFADKNLDLLNIFNNLFTIRCPPSINNMELTSSIVYVRDYESSCTNNQLDAFCGQCSYIGNTLVSYNTQSGNYLCFAYRLLNNYVQSIITGVSINDDTSVLYWQTIPFTPIADQNWHYTCIDVRAKYISQSVIDSSVSSIIIYYAYLEYNIKNGILLDTVTVRTVLPLGYESSVVSANAAACVFPFYYNGKSYSTCTVDENNLPICADELNQTYTCSSSAFEGVRRLFPKHQLVSNTLKVQHTSNISTIDIYFRYNDCTSPSLLMAWPNSSVTVTRVASASNSARGTFDLVFNGQTYPSIPVDISAADLTNRLQSSSDFGFLNIKRSRDCTGYSYTIEWISNGGQKSSISITNISSITPIGTTVTVVSIQKGGVLYKPLPGDMTRTFHIQPQVEVLVGGYPSKCSSYDSCSYQWLSSQTPTISSVVQNGMVLTITGTGFNSTIGGNQVTIGTSGTCLITSAMATLLTCTISSAPAGSFSIKVNVADKGLATEASNSIITIPLQISSISPTQGGAGGGYKVNITGTGFSTSSVVTIDGNTCSDAIVTNFSLIVCTVPPTTVLSNRQVSVVVISDTISETLSNAFTYDVTNTPSIISVTPTVFSIVGGEFIINGTNFGTDLATVFVGTTKATVISTTSTQITAILPSLPPGIYSVRISTNNGYARPMISIEYRFYIQTISPQVGSLYGGTDVFVQGEGFDSSSIVTFTGDDNTISCDIISIQSNQIHCKTTTALPRMIVSSNGIDSAYSSGFAWSPQYAVVQQGTIVEWQWNTSVLLSTLNYKIQQIENSYDTIALADGFDSGTASSSGSFSYQFQTVGTYYYWSPSIDPTGQISMRGSITVVPAEPQILEVQVTSNILTDISNFTCLAQSCAFPFQYNSINYTSCTTDDDTEQWCSPTFEYTGQRLYCTPTADVQTNSSSPILDPSSCSQTVPTSNSLQFLFTSCTIGSVISITPTQGSAGTIINITGTDFSLNEDENIVLIGSSYSCPILNASSTELICQIDTNSELNAKSIENVRVIRDRQGYLSTQGLIQFQFQAQIFDISPTQGSIAGNTQITITGDGFVPDDTRIIVGSIEYTSLARITYSQIQFHTQIPPSNYINQAIPITILVGSHQALCSTNMCTYTWSQDATPYLTSVSPTSITGSQTLNLIGENFAVLSATNALNVQVSINNEICNVTSVTNTTIVCDIASISNGNYPIIITIDNVGQVISSVSLASIVTVSSVSPTSGSIYGGTILTINGNGFAHSIDDIQVIVGASLCPIIETTPGQLQCFLPAQGLNPSTSTITIISSDEILSSSTTFTYDADVTPTIVSISPTTGTSGQQLVISGSNFVINQTDVTIGGVPCLVTDVSSSLITCTIDSSSAGNQSVLVSVTSIGQSNTNIQFQYALQLTNISPSQGSYGGGQSITINGDGFNSTSINVTICGQTCQSLNRLSNTQIICITPATTISSMDTTCNLIVTVDNLSQSTSYTYTTNLTATITSVSPVRGGTGGGTLLTIIGTNFPLVSTDAVTVSIADVLCTVESVSVTTLTCSTGSYFQTTIQAPIIVNLVDGGNAIGSVVYQYIDLWSSPWTWGGSSPPEQGTIVAIENGKTVYFDTTTPILKAVIIDNASLIFDDHQDVALNAEYILVVNGGRLQIGTELNPFQHKAILTMYGHLRSIELPIFGAKTLALRDGTVDIHGRSVTQTWTQLAETAVAGTMQIRLVQSVDWPVGSQIVIATTGDYLSQGQSEIRTIENISDNGRTLTLNSPLIYQHLGLSRTIGSTTVDIRAEVGLLSHNVIFQGSITETWNQTIEACPTGFNPGEFAVQTCFLGRYGEDIGSDQFGATIMVSASAESSSNTQQAILRLSNIEIFNAGQGFRLGRYPVHFHMNGNMNLSYIKSCSIHQTYNRAVNIHATHYLTVENNVIYNIMGGAMFLEDGVEVGNVLRGNLAIFVRTSSSLLNEDVTPAAFWVTNPNNIVENNAVAGGTHFGYWYRMLRTPDGPSYAMYPNYCPYRRPFGRFYNNSVHSVGRFGVWIFPEYSPSVAGSCWNDAPYQAVFDRLISWKNSRGFEWVMSSSIQIRNTIVFDNDDTGIRCVTAINHQATNLPNLRTTFYNENTGSSVINSIIIGDLGVSQNSIVPNEGGLVVMWDRGLRVRNLSFFNFPNANTQAIFGPIIAGRCLVFCGGWLTKFSQLSFTNVTNRGHFRWAYDGIYKDEDGSLSNIPNSIILPADGLWNTSNQCTRTSNFLNAITCPVTLGSWIRFAFNEASLGKNGDNLYVYDSLNHSTVVPFCAKRLTHPNGYMMTLLARRSYLLRFENANSSVNLSYSGIAYGLEPGDSLIISHKIDYKPDQVYTTSSISMATQSLTVLSNSTNSNGDWYYDNNTSLFSYLIKNPSTNSLSIDVGISLNVIKCRYANCEAPPQPGLELPAIARPITALYWANDSDWSFAFEGYGGFGGVKPGNNTNIYIPRGIWLVVNYPLPRIRSLQIEGVLEFEQNMDNVLRVESIFINGGQMIVGWPNDPLRSKVDIIINSSSTVNVLLPNNAGSMGPKVLGVFGGLDLHGIPHNITWTRLNSTALSGQSSIILSEPIDWSIGDEIIITTTDTNLEHTERHTIANISSNKLILTTINPLVYTHQIIHNRFPNGKFVHIAAAVGLLTRNIRVIDPSRSNDLFGFRILISDYSTNVWDVIGQDYINTYYKGYARLSNVQFMNFGQFVDASDEDKREGIHIYNLGDWNVSRPTYVDSCSFDGGSYSAIGLWQSNGIPITNNIVYKTYQSAIVINGKNNRIEKNLVSTVYWSGTAQPQIAEFNINYDGAIMSRDAISVIMKENLIAGVERIAYRIQGNSCSNKNLPDEIVNDYENNEAHSAMAGVVLWPQDIGFQYDTNCLFIKGFIMYKTWHYGLYLNTPRNIRIDSCTIVDTSVGIFTLVLTNSPLLHQFGNNSIHISNSLIIGDITNDCTDTANATTLSARYSAKAVPLISTAMPASRVGISFPYFSGDNMIPRHPWTGVGRYPGIDGIMTLTNITFAFFNDRCLRRDFVLHVSQNNDDGQHPIVSRQISVYNTSIDNLIFNGRPNLDVVNPSDCVDMDCDGLKKALITDLDGSLFGQVASVFSQAEYLWGNQAHGVGDYRIPSVALSNQTGHQININISYPYRGISRSTTCTYISSWQMYFCPNTIDYRMLIIESMDTDTETRRLSPVAIMSDNGYIDLVNGPQDHGWCNGYTCQKRISTFMSLIESQHAYEIYLSSTTPTQIRFRLLNSDASIKAILSIYYDSLQQIDVYANNIYISPMNRDLNSNNLILTDEIYNLSTTNSPGSNYFNRTTRMASFVIDGQTTIDLKISQLIILNFNLPAQTPSSFYSSNLTINLAAILGISPDKIRRVNIISANNNSRIRRQSSSVSLSVEIRDDPLADLSTVPTVESINNICSAIINQYQSGELQQTWSSHPSTGNTSLIELNIREPMNQTLVSLSIIHRIELVTSPNACREQSPCSIQPKLVAYDINGLIIDKLGSTNQPWQVQANVIGNPNITLINPIANYSNGQTQYTAFGLPNLGNYQIQFAFIQPNNVTSSFTSNVNLTANSSSLTISKATLSAKQIDPIATVSINETFNISIILIDSQTRLQIGNIQWRNLSWLANVSLFTLPEYNSNGKLIQLNTSKILIDIQTGKIIAINLAIDQIGMYILKVQLKSTNNEYEFSLKSTAILVKQNSTILQSDTGYPSSNITFNADYDSFEKLDLLEIKRAIIYNYLISIGLPISSPITLTKGSIVVSFVSGSNATSLSSAVETMSNNPNVLSDLEVKSININGQTYSTSKSTSDSTSQSSDTTAMIVIIVVGLVASILLILGVYFGMQYYESYHARERLIDENVEMKKSTRISSGRGGKNQVQPLNGDDDRPASDTVSVNMLNFHN